MNKNINLTNNLMSHAIKGKILEKNEEFELISRWQKHQDQDALKKILNSYLRLAVSYAKKYTYYGIPIDDLIHEGVLGIMHALDKFDISKDFRLSTYASWWVRASIQDYILKNWSIVKTGSTASQKQLFFNLKKIKQQILEVSKEYLGQKEIDEVSNMLKVKPFEIQTMESRLTSGDVFFNQPIGDEDGNDLMSIFPDNSPNPEDITEDLNDNKSKSKWLSKAIDTLSDREQIIVKSRKLLEKSLTLDELGKNLKISKERVRQIETRALEKLKKSILQISQQEKEFFI